MARDFLYCEETDTKIYSDDIVTISSFSNVKFIAKQGWYKYNSTRIHGWYFISIADKSVVPIDAVDIKDIKKDEDQAHSSGKTTEVKPTTQKTEDVNYILTADQTLYPNDIVTLSDYPDTNWVLKKGWYKLGTAQKTGWYVINISDRTIIPLEDLDVSTMAKEIEVGTSEFKPTLKDIDTKPMESSFILIPGTNIRLYDGDVVKISGKPRIKWVVHTGWYIYDGNQNYGWYFVSIKNGDILPVGAIDLTLCTLVTVKTQGAGVTDGKVVNYTRPFTVADAEILNRAFITLDTLEQRDNLDKKKIINGKMVRVNNEEGPANYYAWNSETQTWDFLEVFGIPELVGTTENPIILSELEPALYRVKGTYKISPNHPTVFMTAIDHLSFVDEEDNIKVITEHHITDYVVEGDEVTFVNNYATEQYIDQHYATKVYVDNKIAVVEAEISEIISEFHDKVTEIVYEVLDVALNGIEEEYIDNLFN